MRLPACAATFVASRQAGEGGRSANVSGLPAALYASPAQAAQVIPLAALKESVNRMAYRYAEAHIAPGDKIGNKGGSPPALRGGTAGGSNRLRAALSAYPSYPVPVER